MTIERAAFAARLKQNAEESGPPQAAQKGPDARRRVMGRVKRTSGTPQRAPEQANAADGPFSAAC
jgi:hypothetical protein